MLLFFGLAACSPTSAAGRSVELSSAWVRPSQATSAGYLQISNSGRSEVKLVGVETAAAAQAELHEVIMDDDVMRMKPVESIVIPARETVDLKPGGYHIMLAELAKPLAEGDAIDLTLRFDDGISRNVSARVSSIQPAMATDALTRDAEEAAMAGTYLGQISNPPVLVEDFVAPSTLESVTSLNDLAGNWRMIFFGYMHCPDFCPLTLVDYRQTNALLGDAAADVTFVFISVDAVRDPPDKMRTYLAKFDPDFVGYSVPDATLSRIQPDYGFYYERRLDSGEGAVYTIDHSTRSYLLDPAGRLRASFPYDTAPEALAEALRWYVTNE